MPSALLGPSSPLLGCRPLLVCVYECNTNLVAPLQTHVVFACRHPGRKDTCHSCQRALHSAAGELRPGVLGRVCAPGLHQCPALPCDWPALHKPDVAPCCQVYLSFVYDWKAKSRRRNVCSKPAGYFCSFHGIARRGRLRKIQLPGL